MKKILIPVLLLLSTSLMAQGLKDKFAKAYQELRESPNYKHAIIGLQVVNTQTGEKLFEENSITGLPAASSQKIITASAAYELLQPDFAYKTTLGYTGKIVNGTLKGNIIIKGSGDPTLGSWRYEKTKEGQIIKTFSEAISQAGINELDGHVLYDESAWDGEVTPDGWVWQDIGNYYGAGPRALNWRENQYDLLLSSGSKLHSPVSIVGTLPDFIAGLKLRSAVTAAAAGTGDNGYIYLPLGEDSGWVRGTIPVNQKAFKISGSIPNPPRQLAITLEAALKNTSPQQIASDYPEGRFNAVGLIPIFTWESPTLDSISYWFLKKSINLYGEALAKTLGEKFGDDGSTESGVKVIQGFWKKQGLEPYAVNIQDGSGLSPGNRITANVLVSVLRYAMDRPWFSSFYYDLPVIHNIHMKSGTINGVLSYTGFVGGGDGMKYTFAFIINDYDGSANKARRDMWKLLDVLK